jgi:predicted DNA-binding protein (MmcQ/YjbR family)
MINIEQLRDYALQLIDVTEGFPFGEDILVFKVNNKMFLLVALDAQPLRFNVKCEPEKAIELREAFPASVLPGYHMNKKHWNTVVVDGVISAKQLLQMVAESYRLVQSRK